MTASDDPPVKATRTSDDVLQSLIETGGATLTDLVGRLAYSKSSLHNHLETLTQLGFVVKEGRTYRPSLRFLEIGAAVREQDPFYRIARPQAVRIANAVGLNTSLLVLERGHLTCLYTVAARQGDPLIDDGDIVPLHCTAPGKAILAASADETVRELITAQDACTENTLTTRRDLREELEDIRSQGWAVDREEWQPGVRGVATAVTDQDGDLLGALCVTGTTDSLSGKRFEQDIPGLLISATNEIRTALK